jgi:hypothetical protein
MRQPLPPPQPGIAPVNRRHGLIHREVSCSGVVFVIRRDRWLIGGLKQESIVADSTHWPAWKPGSRRTGLFTATSGPKRWSPRRLRAVLARPLKVRCLITAAVDSTR